MVICYSSNRKQIYKHTYFINVCAKSLQSCPALCNPMDCSPPGSSVHGDSPDKSTGVGCHALFQEIFPIQGSTPRLLHLLHYRQILYSWATREAHSFCIINLKNYFSGKVFSSGKNYLIRMLWLWFLYFWFFFSHFFNASSVHITHSQHFTWTHIIRKSLYNI